MSAPGAGAPKLRVEALAKSYGERPVLGGVDLAVGAGEFVSVVGRSGCGKSTMFQLIAGLREPSSGRILLDGEASEPAERRLGRVGYMPQRDSLLPWRTVLDNAALGLELGGAGRRAARQRALAEFERFGLAGYEREWPASLSGGMRQRAALLRTFLAGQELLLLDEPFGALDALTREDMQEWLLEVWQGAGKTILFVTHDVDEALFLSDRVCVMAGRPATIVTELEVGLPRRERRQLATDPRLLELKRRLLDPLRQSGGGGAR